MLNVKAEMVDFSCFLAGLISSSVIRLHAELGSDTPRQSLVHCVNSSFVFQQVPVDLCVFGLPFRKRFTLFSVNVPVHLKLARRCDNFDRVCSFSGKAQRQL